MRRESDNDAMDGPVPQATVTPGLPELGQVWIRVRGCLDLRLCEAFRRAAGLGADRPGHYLVDLSGVDAVRDSGLSLLILLARLTAPVGAIRVLGCPPALRERVRRLGEPRIALG